MKNLFLSLILFLLPISGSVAQQNLSLANEIYICDGPYIYYEHDSLKAFWIKNDKVFKEYLTPENFSELKSKFNFTFNFSDLTATRNISQNYNQNFSRIDSIGIISDIHGEFNTYIDLLKSTGIIDDDNNWKFGKGHLLVTGDVFDRGDKVTEVLWHLFGLEKQAEDAGGEVHLLLGNHELMILENNITYISNKYRKVQELSGISYSRLYSTSSVLGNWLRSKPVMVTINDILFVHAGISSEMINRKMSSKKVNHLFEDELMGRPLDSVSLFNDLPFLITESGPVWYRGYFSGEPFSESKLDSILDFYRIKHIVVGHTPIPRITCLYNKKIIGVDTGIMLKKSPEMLLYKEGIFYRSSIKGKRTKL
jgi:hypothetical protein